MYSMYISHENELYLVFSSGEIFKSVEVDEIGFQPYNMINENIRKVCTGMGFEAIVTESNKLLTTFSEKSSARSTNGYIKIPRELKKFANLDILDAVSGSHHMLVHAVHKVSPNTTPEDSSMTEFDVSCGEMRVSEMNDLNRTYTKLQLNGNHDTAGAIDEDENQNIPPIGVSAKSADTHEVNNQIERNTAVTVTVSKIPISEQMKRRSSSNASSLPTSRKNSNDAAVTEAANEKPSVECDRNRITPGSIEKSLSLKEFEKLEQEHAATGEHANETEEKLVNVEEVDERVSTSTASSHKSTVSLTATAAAPEEPVDLLEATQTPPHWIQTPPPFAEVTANNESANKIVDDEDNHSPTVDEMIESRLNKDEQLQVIVQQNEQGTSIAELRRQSTIDPLMPQSASPPSNLLIQRHDSEITFIDNGVDVTQDVEDSFGSEPEPDPDEIRMHSPVSKEPMPTTDKIVDTLLGEKLLSTYVVPPIMDTKEETKKALEEVFEVKSTAPTATKDSSDRDGDSERTTASISSISPDKSQPIMTEVAHIGNGSTTGSNSSIKESGKVRRFINDLKTKGRNMSCSNSNAIASVVSESML